MSAKKSNRDCPTRHHDAKRTQKAKIMGNHKKNKQMNKETNYNWKYRTLSHPP